MRSTDNRDSPSVTAEAVGEDAVRFTFPDGSAFVRQEMRHVFAWTAVMDITEGIAHVELYCRDEYARWATMIFRNESGVYEEHILMPRSAHHEPQTRLPTRAESLRPDESTVPSVHGHKLSAGSAEAFRFELPLLTGIP